MPSARGVTSVSAAGWAPPGKRSSVRSDVRCLTNSEPSEPLVAKLRSRVDEPIERIAAPCGSNSCALTSDSSPSELARARNQPLKRPFRSPTSTELPPRPNSTAVSGASLTFAMSVSRDSDPASSQ